MHRIKSKPFRFFREVVSTIKEGLRTVFSKSCVYCDGEGSYPGIAPHELIDGVLYYKPENQWSANYQPSADDKHRGIHICPCCAGTGMKDAIL